MESTTAAAPLDLSLVVRWTKGLFFCVLVIATASTSALVYGFLDRQQYQRYEGAYVALADQLQRELGYRWVQLLGTLEIWAYSIDSDVRSQEQTWHELPLESLEERASRFRRCSLATRVDVVTYTLKSLTKSDLEDADLVRLHPRGHFCLT